MGKLGVCGFGALESINSPMGFNLFIVFRNRLRYRSVYDSQNPESDSDIFLYQNRYSQTLFEHLNGV